VTRCGATSPARHGICVTIYRYRASSHIAYWRISAHILSWRLLYNAGVMTHCRGVVLFAGQSTLAARRGDSVNLHCALQRFASFARVCSALSRSGALPASALPCCHAWRCGIDSGGAAAAIRRRRAARAAGVNRREKLQRGQKAGSLTSKA